MNLLDAVPPYASTHAYRGPVRWLNGKCACRNADIQRHPFRFDEGILACS